MDCLNVLEEFVCLSDIQKNKNGQELAEFFFNNWPHTAKNVYQMSLVLKLTKIYL